MLQFYPDHLIRYSLSLLLVSFFSLAFSPAYSEKKPSQSHALELEETTSFVRSGNELQTLHLNNIGLKEVEQLALQRNLDVLAARFAVEEHYIEKILAQMFVNPSINYSLNDVILGRGNEQGIPGFDPAPFSQLQHGVWLNQSLDIWWKRSLRLKVARLDIQAANYDFLDALRQIIYQVRSAYAELLREQWEYQLATQLYDRYQQGLRLSQRRFSAGEISQTEFRKVELESLKYKNDAITAKAQLAEARQLLATMLVLPVNSLPEQLQESSVDIDVSYNEETILSQAMQQRPDLQALRAYQKKTHQAQSLATREAFPDLSVGLGYTRSFFLISGDNPHALGFSVGFDIPLFDRNQAGRYAASLNIRELNNQEKKLEWTILEDVRLAIVHDQKNKQLVRNFRDKMLSRAEELLAVAERSAHVGAISLLEMLEAQRTYLAIKADHLRSQYDALKTHIDLLYVTAQDIPEDFSLPAIP